jgi:hypothetical protein
MFAYRQALPVYDKATPMHNIARRLMAASRGKNRHPHHANDALKFPIYAVYVSIQ